jgi:hypothetical protein
MISKEAPKKWNKGLMVRRPIGTMKPTSNSDRTMLSVVSLFTLLRFPSPIECEITAEAPMATAWAKLFTKRTTGKVKLIAASWPVPSWPTKKVSVKLKIIMLIVPKIMGIVSMINVFGMGPSINREFLSVIIF